jgi:hypothetical protein
MRRLVFILFATAFLLGGGCAFRNQKGEESRAIIPGPEVERVRRPPPEPPPNIPLPTPVEPGTSTNE